MKRIMAYGMKILSRTGSGMAYVAFNGITEGGYTKNQPHLGGKMIHDIDTFFIGSVIVGYKRRPVCI